VPFLTSSKVVVVLRAKRHVIKLVIDFSIIKERVSMLTGIKHFIPVNVKGTQHFLHRPALGILMNCCRSSLRCDGRVRNAEAAFEEYGYLLAKTEAFLISIADELMFWAIQITEVWRTRNGLPAHVKVSVEVHRQLRCSTERFYR